MKSVRDGDGYGLPGQSLGLLELAAKEVHTRERIPPAVCASKSSSAETDRLSEANVSASSSRSRRASNVCELSRERRKDARVAERVAMHLMPASKLVFCAAEVSSELEGEPEIDRIEAALEP